MLAIWIDQKYSFKIAKKKYVIQDFETEKLHWKWAGGGAKTFKWFFLETIFMPKLWDTLSSSSGGFLSTDLKFGSFIAK